MTQQDDTRERLLHAAGEIFADKGYGSATVREICSRAAVNIAAVNYHFRDKESLYLSAVQRAHCVHQDDLPFPDPTTSDLTGPQKLYQYVYTFLSRIMNEDRPAWHIELMMRELARPSKACEQVVHEYIRPMAMILGQIVDELVPEGTGQTDCHLICFSIVGQCLYYRTSRPVAEQLVGPTEFRGYTVELLADHITQFSLRALGINVTKELWRCPV